MGESALLGVGVGEIGVARKARMADDHSARTSQLAVPNLRNLGTVEVSGSALHQDVE